MIATVRRPLALINGNMPRDAQRNTDVGILKPGRYRIERALHPHIPGIMWLALEGTNIGASEPYWRSWCESTHPPDEPGVWVIAVSISEE